PKHRVASLLSRTTAAAWPPRGRTDRRLPHQATFARPVVRRSRWSPRLQVPCDDFQDVVMTDDGLPAAARPGAGDKPELRASIKTGPRRPRSSALRLATGC